MSKDALVYNLQTKTAKLAVSTLGAELTSWQPDGHTEYLHQPDWQWASQAPLLFPFVGGLHQKNYTWQGKTYEMPKHGFLRDRLFIYEKDKSYQKEDAACLCLSYKSTKEDLQLYPFSFSIETCFYLQDRQFRQVLQISNLSNDTLYFACGFHPAFNLPKHLGDKVTDFALRFPNKSSLKRLQLDFQTGLQLDKLPADWPLQEQTWAWQLKDFANDCWFFQTAGSDVELIAKKEQKVILRLQSDLDVLGVWQPYQALHGADFICLEPWTSSVGPFNKLADLGNWPDRLSLAKGTSCSLAYTVTACL